MPLPLCFNAISLRLWQTGSSIRLPREENCGKVEKLHSTTATLLAFMLSEPSQCNCFCNNVFHFPLALRQLKVYLMKSFCHLLLRDV